METEMINKLFLELSQVATAKTKRDFAVEAAIQRLRKRAGALEKRREEAQAAGIYEAIGEIRVALSRM